MNITKEHIEAYDKARGAYEAEKDRIVNRIDEIIKLINNYFGFEILWWSFCHAPEGEVGELDLRHSEITFEICYHNKHSLRSIVLETWCYNYRFGFPKIFLVMTDQQITDYLVAENAETERRQKKKLEQAAECKKTKAELVNSALQKLTDDERKALKL